MDNKKKIEEIKKYFKKHKNFLELYFNNYENHNIYITINLTKKNTYKLSWFDLDFMEKGRVEKYLSYEYIPEDLINYIKEKYKNIDVPEYRVILEKDNIVELNANIKTKERNNISITFNKYIPKELIQISELFIIIFDNLPRKLQSFLFEIHAVLTGTVMNYEYGKEIDFDLFNGNLETVFPNKIIERGRKYYKEGLVINLEIVDGKYFSTVKGNRKYSSLIEYDKENKKMKMFCSYPCNFYCKHLYATILAIRNKSYKKFYKIVYQNPNINMLDNMTNSKYFLCLGTNNDNFEIIDQHGNIIEIPIIDNNGKCNWKIVDDIDNELSKKVKNILSSRMS